MTKSPFIFILILTACFLSATGQPIRISPADQSREVPAFGFNNNIMNSPMQFDSYRDTVSTLHPSLVRYPGGTVSDYFRWKIGWVDTTILPARFEWWKSYNVLPMKPEDFMGYMADISASPVFVLNAFSSNLTQQKALLEKIEELGEDVRYVELGNEYYEDRDRYNQQYPTAEYYGRAMETWIDTLRKAFPSTRYCAIGASITYNAGERRKTWNEDLFKVLQDADAVCLHPYFGVPDDIEQQPDAINKIIGAAYRRWTRFKETELETIPVEMDIWLTEYNLFDPQTKGVRTTWSHGLVMAFYTMLLMQERQITMLLPHQIAGNPSFASIKTEAPFTQPQPYPVSAYGHAMGVIFEMMRGAEVARKLEFSSLPEITVDLVNRTLTYPKLFGWQLDQNGAIILNNGKSSEEVKFEQTDYSYRVQHSQIEQPLKTDVTRQDLLSDPYTTSGSILLPPHSLTKITFEASTGIRDQENSRGTALSVYPNPSSSNVTFQFTLQQKKQVKLQIYDVLGRKVIELESAYMTPGVKNIRVDNLPVSNKMLFGVLKVGGHRTVKSFYHLK